ncbi:tRNA lysidine(34) synthetase TilS [Telmatospirillum sp. J64-1]|uniref:tRNA lysidine(34) synthetase TilS n=1 Tax=Telmatospirillum sp. J64-1 TaxID=2502183 RepID=UPI00115D8B61|nr:tRNA lysidine(34) synthetase TilS [Telmatospirillum sp. J64-1]
MERLGPFESRPILAVAVSGGADSLALCLLADDWARRRGGSVLALTVDHRLRAESGAEAARVGEWLAGRAIAHRILRWDDPKPRTGLQAAAREARYALLEEACAESGILHLLLAHHRADQAETVLLRQQRGSGMDGLAGMSAIVERPSLRLLRPLLACRPEDLRGFLREQGQDWIEDPSNGNPAFARVRLRMRLAEDGGETERLLSMSRRAGQERAALEEAVAQAAARSVLIHPVGYALWRVEDLGRLPEEVGLRLLSRLVCCMGGRAYPPRAERLRGIYDQLRSGRRDLTLGGCLLAARRDGLLVCREPGRLTALTELRPDKVVLWDGRYRMFLSPEKNEAVSPPGAAKVAALGAQGWRDIRSHLAGEAGMALPEPVRLGLPAIYDEHGISAVPQLGYKREGGRTTDARVPSVLFAPRITVTGAGHCLVW